MAYQTIVAGVYPANASCELTGQLTDVDGTTPVPGSAITTLVLTLYEAVTGAVINACRQRVIDPVLVDGDGNLTLLLSAADMALIGVPATGRPFVEGHVALLEWTWASPVRAGRHWILFNVAEGPPVV